LKTTTTTTTSFYYQIEKGKKTYTQLVISRTRSPTLLQYARNLANTVYESIKHVVPWSAYYFTRDKSYYPVLRQSTPLNAIPKLEHLKAIRQLNRQERDLMIELMDKLHDREV